MRQNIKTRESGYRCADGGCAVSGADMYGRAQWPGLLCHLSVQIDEVCGDHHFVSGRPDEQRSAHCRLRTGLMMAAPGK